MDAVLGEPHRALHDVGALNSGVQDDDRHAWTRGVDARRQPIDGLRRRQSRGPRLRRLTLRHVLVDGVDLAAADDVVELVEEHPAPGVLYAVRGRRGVSQSPQSAHDLGVQQQTAEPPVCLLVADPRAIGALKDRVQLTIDHWELGRVAYGIEMLLGVESEVGGRRTRCCGPR